MGLWDRLQTELNRAGKVAQGALDEGRVRLEIFRVRQLADKAAQALGYAVYRAKARGEDVDATTWDRLAATLRDHEAEAKRLDAELQRVRAAADGAPAAPAEATPADAPAAGVANDTAAASASSSGD